MTTRPGPAKSVPTVHELIELEKNRKSLPVKCPCGRRLGTAEVVCFCHVLTVPPKGADCPTAVAEVAGYADMPASRRETIPDGVDPMEWLRNHPTADSRPISRPHITSDLGKQDEGSDRSEQTHYSFTLRCKCGRQIRLNTRKLLARWVRARMAGVNSIEL